MIQVDNINILNALQYHEEGELALVLDEQKIYQYNNGWRPYISENTQLGLSVYEINQQVISQLPSLDANAIQNGINIINQYTKTHCYYMLLCRDINYYTLFETGWDESNETVGEAVIDCFNYLHAELKTIDLTDDGKAIEIWFTIIINETPTTMCAYFFNYDEGVILCV